MRKSYTIMAVVMSTIMILSLVLAAGTSPAQAQDPAFAGEFLVEEAYAAAPEVTTMNWQAEMPKLTAEQMAQLEAGMERTNLAGPARPGAEGFVSSEAPDLEAQTITSLTPADAPLVPAPGDISLFRKGWAPTAGLNSNVMETSVANNGRFIWITGNWFAARSQNSGLGWTYVNPFADYPDFCCDQVTIQDEARDALYWLRMAVPDGAGVNTFKLGMSPNGGASFCTYTFTPAGVNGAWTNQWFDYPHIQLGADYMYLAWNMFNAGGSWTRSLMMRLPLDSMRNCAGFGYSYLATSDWFTFVPVSGANHTMYFASNYPMLSPFNRIAIWKWAESSGSISAVVKTIAAWSYTGRGEAWCGAASPTSNGNWAARTDDRLLTGARYELHGTNVQVPGRMVLGWWWNVKQGGSFLQPYIDAAAFYEDDFSQVAGLQGRPYVFNSSSCWLYPSVGANKRGDLGMVANISYGEFKRPAVFVALADDYGATPPGWNSNAIFWWSNALPLWSNFSNRNIWGDYNTSRANLPAADAWIGGAHVIGGTSNCANCSSPVYFVYGRYRDFYSWVRFYNK